MDDESIRLVGLIKARLRNTKQWEEVVRNTQLLVAEEVAATGFSTNDTLVILEPHLREMFNSILQNIK